MSAQPPKKVFVDVDILEELIDTCDPESRYLHRHVNEDVIERLRADIEQARNTR